VRQQAVRSHLLKADATITEQEAFNLLFQSGFSTAAAVSNISGRGVGLDVVKSEIAEIGGTVEVESVRGAGAAFILNLPLTSSLNRALVFAVQDLMVGGKPRREQSIKTIGIVPLGTPIIVGPGVLTTLLLVLQQHGYGWTISALAANLLIVFIALRGARWILSWVGEGVSVALAKIASLLLAAIAVMMIRLGIEGVLAAR
jgi:hypothetical protein